MIESLNQGLGVGRIAGKVGGEIVKPPAAPGDAAKSFQQLLSDALGKVNDMQLQAESGMTQLAAGEPVDLHDVMLLTEQANMALQLTLQVRNKLIEAYQEIMRMPV